MTDRSRNHVRNIFACGVLPAITLAFALAYMQPAFAQNRPEGITEPTIFRDFDASAPACQAPRGLKRTLVFAQDNAREFMQGVGFGLEQAARDRKLDYRVALADNDAQRMVDQVGDATTNDDGALVAAPIDPSSLAPELQAFIWNGGYVGTVVPPPATTLLNAPQYLTGKALGDTAAAYIREKLGGKAKVVLLTHDNLQFLAPRFAAMRDALSQLPDVEIVADITPATINKEGGAATMEFVLLAHPDIDVVLGADTVVLGALAALRKAGKARPDQFLGGIDGEPEAVAELKTAGSPYKASIALASPIFGYALGQYAADWLDGKSVPQAMDILPFTLTPASVMQYERDSKDPASVFKDEKRRQAYLHAYGGICYDSRDRYVNFPWSSEAEPKSAQ